MLIQVEVSDPIEISSGVFKTTLTHGKLEGELSFIHGSSNRSITLASLEESMLGNFTEIVSLIGDLTNGKGKRTSTSSLPSSTVGSTSPDT